MKQYFVAGMLCLLAFYGAVSYASAEAPVVYNEIRFTDEMWGQVYLDVSKQKPVYLKELAFTLPEPPANDSKETRADLDAMLKQQATARTPETVAKIKQENSGNPFYAFERAGLLDPAVNKKAETLLQVMDTDIAYYLMREKLKFKRARPTQLEPKLTTVIPVPGHASYPSAHSAQMHAAAYLLGDLDPPNAKKYLQLADDVAVRREIAGVHYHGDTEAGIKLARAFYDEFIKVPEIATMVADAKQQYPH